MSDNQKTTPDTAPDKKDTVGDEQFDFDISIDDADLNKMQSSEHDSQDAGPALTDEPTPKHDDMSAGILDFEEIEEPPKNKMPVALIAAAVLVGVVVLSLFGYFALSILGGGNSQVTPPQQSNVQGASQFGAEGPTGLDSGFDGGNNILSPSPQEVAQALEETINNVGLTSKAVAEPGPTATHAQGEKNLIITYGAEAQVAEAVEVDSVLSQPSPPKLLTDEDRLYDNLLTSVESMDVPPEAIKIDQAVINRRLESQRLDTLETDLKGARESMASISGSVESIRAQVAGFSTFIDRNSAEQAAMSASIGNLTAEVKQAAAAQKKELKALKAAVANAQKRADQAVASAGEAKVVASTRPVVEPRAPVETQPKPAPAQASPARAAAPAQQQQAAPVVAPSRVFADTPTPRAVQAPTPINSNSAAALPAHCDGSRVSANWRVKGVNSHSAYVVRTQDQQGIYLKTGVEVPGYGHVQSFDANSRAICTTSGLIRR